MSNLRRRLVEAFFAAYVERNGHLTHGELADVALSVCQPPAATSAVALGLAGQPPWECSGPVVPGGPAHIDPRDSEITRLSAENEQLRRANLDGAASETQLIEENARLTRERARLQEERDELVKDLSKSSAKRLKDQKKIAGLQAILSALTGEDMRDALLRFIAGGTVATPAQAYIAGEIMALLRQKAGADK